MTSMDSNSSVNPSRVSDNLLPVLQGISSLGTANGLCAMLDSLDDDQSRLVNVVVSVMVMKDYLLKHVQLNHMHTVFNPSASDAPPTLVLHCTKCNEPVTMPSPENRWYAVFSGVRVGWVRGWDRVKNLVLHVPGNRYSSYKSMDDARKAFIYAFVTRHVEVLVLDSNPSIYDPVPQVDGLLFP